MYCTETLYGKSFWDEFVKKQLFNVIFASGVVLCGGRGGGGGVSFAKQYFMHCGHVFVTTL